MPDVPLFLGIDGGASSTVCAAVDATGRLVGVGRAGPVDHLYHERGRRTTRTALAQSIRGALRGTRARRSVLAAVAGLTGLEPGSSESAHAIRMIRAAVPAKTIRATWDVEVAFAGAAAGAPGVLVIAGTGSVAYGRSAEGRTARAGGYGYLIDDAGGGVQIGQAGLRAALRAADGMGPKTRLRPLMEARLGGWPEIRARVYGEGGGRMLLASLVPVVIAAARQGDWVARDILQAAARSLADLALAVADRLDLSGRPFTLYPVGGIFRTGPLILDPLQAALRSNRARCRIERPTFPPVIGAVLMAMEAAGMPPAPQVLQRLSTASQRLRLKEP